ncbi:hypothetical protein [Candidatus Viadribacter manganicus]|nr:hypothetical protein [Candidatus Viadribacter manganicus]
MSNAGAIVAAVRLRKERELSPSSKIAARYRQTRRFNSMHQI